MKQIVLNNKYDDLDFFVKGLADLELDVSDYQLSQFCKYYELLVEKNKDVNLTAITEFKDVFIKHFIDSLSIVRSGININSCKDILDMGTGAGFPGVPIKIMFPDINVTLADSLQKRVNFLMDVIDECGLEDVDAVHSRAEDLCRTNPSSREGFDLCVSRAVASLNVLEEYCLPYVRVGGNFVSYKSGHCDDELVQAEFAAATLGGEIQKDSPAFMLPGTDMSRSLIITKKTRHTNSKYPRKAGVPGKKPLIH